MGFFLKKSKTKIPTTPIQYPSGICVRTPQGAYRIGTDGKRYRIVSERIMRSWNFPFVVETTEEALRKHPVAVTKLGFRDGTLLNNFADGKMYLVSGAKLRHIKNPDFLEYLGVTLNDSLVVSDKEIQIMKQGEPIN